MQDRSFCQRSPWPLLLAIQLAACSGSSDPQTGDDDDTSAPGGDDDSAAAYPDLFCPGDPSGICAPSEDAELTAGAAQVAITPSCWERWEDIDGDDEYDADTDTFEDCGCDQLCEGDDGYPGADEGEGDGELQTVWLAGSGHGRALREAHDDIWVRAIVLTQGNTTLAIASADVVGLFRGPVKDIEEVVRSSAGIDHLVWSSTHTHQGPDTMGLWGPSLTTSGIVDRYWTQLTESAVQAIEEAAAAQQPVEVVAAQVDIQPEDCGGNGVNNFNDDHRDPAILDERVFALQLSEPGGGRTVASLVNWPNHPETLISGTVLTSGFPHYLRNGMEQGVDTPEGRLEGLGGVSLYVQGMCGGMMTTLGVEPVDLMGEVHTEDDFDKVRAIGEYLAAFALEGLTEGQLLGSPELRFKVKEYEVPVENQAYWMMINLGILDREMFLFDIPEPDEQLSEDNIPIARTEVGIVELGPIQILTVPGEMLPEAALGGYDGSHTGPLQDLIDPDNPNPPDLDESPPGPYLVDELQGEYKLFFGLANDELGYIIPPWQFELGSPPYLSEAEGDHYEETNSAGPDLEPRTVETLSELAAWSFPED